MQTELIALKGTETVTRAIDYIRSRHEEVENLHNVYVLDENLRLIGAVPLGDLLFADGNTPLKDIMDRQVVAATGDMDQEEVAALFRKYDLVSLPVVDAERKILGRILVDDIIEVIEEEVSEDMFRMAGISEEEDVVYSGQTFKVCMTRLPWLVFNFFGTLLSGYFLWMYQSRLTDLLALLAFVPVICAMSGNIGVQSTSIVIRGIATGRVDFSNLRKLILKESAVGLIIGLICGILGGVIGFVWQQSWLIGIVVFVAMFIAIAFGALLGVLVPLFFKKIKIDPAVASGSLIATTNDLVAINIYFLFAAFMMKYFVSA
jgi:magnesium transporter